jgi:hypothetical protein
MPSHRCTPRARGRVNSLNKQQNLTCMAEAVSPKRSDRDVTVPTPDGYRHNRDYALLKV